MFGTFKALASFPLFSLISTSQRSSLLKRSPSCSSVFTPQRNYLSTDAHLGISRFRPASVDKYLSRCLLRSSLSPSPFLSLSSRNTLRLIPSCALDTSNARSISSAGVVENRPTTNGSRQKTSPNVKNNSVNSRKTTSGAGLGGRVIFSPTSSNYPFKHPTLSNRFSIRSEIRFMILPLNKQLQLKT